MNIENITIQNKWSESNIIKFFFKYYFGIIMKFVISLCLVSLAYFFTQDFFVNNSFDESSIINLLILICFPFIIYIFARKTVKKLISKCNFFTISDNEILIDGVKLESIDKIFILDSFMIISHLKSYILININDTNPNNLINFITSNNITLIINPNGFSLLKLAYSNKS